MTVTNRTARELRERSAELIGDESAAQLTLGTFHRVCLSMLRADIDKLPPPPPPPRGLRGALLLGGEAEAETAGALELDDGDAHDEYGGHGVRFALPAAWPPPTEAELRALVEPPPAYRRGFAVYDQAATVKLVGQV